MGVERCGSGCDMMCCVMCSCAGFGDVCVWVCLWRVVECDAFDHWVWLGGCPGVLLFMWCIVV
jgi:hypothetical protein